MSMAKLNICSILPLHQPHLLSILGIFLLGTLEGLADLAHGRHVDALALEQFCDGQYLDTRVVPVPNLGVVKAGLGCLRPHRFSRLLQRDEHAHLCILALHHSNQVTHLRDVHMPALDRKDDLLGLPAGVIVEVQPSVDAAVSAFFALRRPRADQA